MKKASMYISAFLMLTLLLACGISLGGVDEEATQMAEMQQTMDHLAAAATGENGQDETAEPETEEDTPEDEEQQPSPTSTWRAAPCNRAELVSETIPDGTVMSPGQTFTKTWEIRNTGTCTWTDEYRIVFDIGHKMNGFTEKSLSQDVDPGDILTVTANLTANSAEGDYRGTYKLKAPDGTAFIKFWTDITVEAEGFDIEPIEPLPDVPSGHQLSDFIFRNVTIKLDTVNNGGPCPLIIKVTSSFIATKAERAIYNIKVCNQNNACEYLNPVDEDYLFNEAQVGVEMNKVEDYYADQSGTYSFTMIVEEFETSIKKEFGPFSISGQCTN